VKQKQHPLFDRLVELDVSGTSIPIRGKLIDMGPDIAVIRGSSQFYYVPLIHIQQLRTSLYEEEVSDDELPFDPETEPISYRKMLMSAKGMFSELYITGNHSIHGYVMSVMNDYFVFYSPVYHSIIISLDHLKYLSPYHPNVTPYLLSPEQFPLKPSSVSLTRTFDQQLRKLVGEFVILDLGESPNRIGVLRGLDGQLLELTNAAGQSVFIHYNHIKTIHFP